MPFRLPFQFWSKKKQPEVPENGLTGSCACGEVTYQLLAMPIFVNCCHCKECQRHTGSAFVLNGIIETANIKLLSGISVPFSVPTTSGAPHDIYHCSQCQTALWSDYNRRPNLRFMKVGTLDDPELCPPQAHIFTDSKAPWLQLDGTIPAYKEFYKLEEVWSEESLKRRQAVT